MWMCGSKPLSEAGTGPSNRKRPKRSVTTLPRPRLVYPFGPACQNSTIAPRSGLQSPERRTRPTRTWPTPIFARRGAGEPVRSNGPAGSDGVARQAPGAARAGPGSAATSAAARTATLVETFAARVTLGAFTVVLVG